MKILFFGDSITRGERLAAPEAERWTARAARALGLVEVNEGKGGRPASSRDEFRAVLADRKGDPGIGWLVLALGANDARDPAPEVPERTAAHVAGMIAEARAAAPAWRIVVCAPTHVAPARLERQEIAASRVRHLRAIGPALRRVAGEGGAAFIDLHGTLPPKSLAADGVHPDAAGHAAIAAAFVAAFPA